MQKCLLACGTCLPSQSIHPLHARERSERARPSPDAKINQKSAIEHLLSFISHSLKLFCSSKPTHTFNSLQIIQFSYSLHRMHCFIHSWMRAVYVRWLTASQIYRAVDRPRCVRAGLWNGLMSPHLGETIIGMKPNLVSIYLRSLVKWNLWNYV